MIKECIPKMYIQKEIIKIYMEREHANTNIAKDYHNVWWQPGPPGFGQGLQE